MRWIIRKRRVEGTYRRARNFEQERAMQALRSMVVFLVVFVVLGLAISPELEPVKVLEEFLCELFGLCGGRQ